MGEKKKTKIKDKKKQETFYTLSSQLLQTKIFHTSKEL